MRTLLLALFLLPAVAASQGPTECETRGDCPHVVVWILDDASPELFHAYGEAAGGEAAPGVACDYLAGETCRTLVAPQPTIDALAADGVLFGEVWASTVCVPTRMQLLYGHSMSESFRSHDLPQETALPASRPAPARGGTLPRVFTDAGYDTLFLGKWQITHNDDAESQRGGVLDFGFRYAWSDFEQNHAYNTFRMWRETGPRGALEVGNYTARLTDRTVEAITTATRPLFAWVASPIPHSPVDEPLGGYSCGLDGVGVDAVERNLSVVDCQLGRIRSALEAKAEPYVLVLVGDNGSVSGFARAQGWPADRCKNSQYRCGYRVPLIVAGPLVPGPSKGQRTEALVEVRDLHNTLRDLAGLAQVESDSRSLVPYLADPSAPSARVTIAAQRWTSATAGVAGARNSTHGLAANLTGSALADLELFDLRTDPKMGLDLMPPDPGEETTAYTELLAVLTARTTWPGTSPWLDCDTGAPTGPAIGLRQRACWSPSRDAMERSPVLDYSACPGGLTLRAVDDSDGDGTGSSARYFVDTCLSADSLQGDNRRRAEDECTPVSDLAGLRPMGVGTCVGCAEASPFVSLRVGAYASALAEGHVTAYCAP